MRLTLNLPAVRLLAHPESVWLDLEGWIAEGMLSLQPFIGGRPMDSRFRHVKLDMTRRGGGVITLPDSEVSEKARWVLRLLEDTRVRYMSLLASPEPGWFVLNPLKNESSPSRTEAFARFEATEQQPARKVERPTISVAEADVVSSLPFARVVLEAKAMVEQFEDQPRLGRPPAGLAEAKRIMAAFEALAARVLPPPSKPSEVEVLKALVARLEAEARTH